VNPDTGLVEFGLKQKLEMNQVVGGEKGIANNKEEKHRMMQNMAQLWLQQEVIESAIQHVFGFIS